ncbi:zinc-dependent alcohol dehydrogenase family protein [Pseudomonadota bacterium]
MQVMQLARAGDALKLVQMPRPEPNSGQILIKVSTCGICRTDLHVVDGELPQTRYPIIPGHQIIGVVEKPGDSNTGFSLGQRVGVPWLGYSCGDCHYCQNGKENLCDQAAYTGCQIDGGFSEYCIANARFCFPVPEEYSDIQAAPLLCAGLIGYRAYKKTNNAIRLGLYGFGAAAHILIQVARNEGRQVLAYTRPGDIETQEFARKLGAHWAGGSDDSEENSLDAAIIFAPVGSLVPLALKAVRKGGIVVCAGIHMSDIPSFPYSILWEERSLCSVANLTRQDGEEFLPLAASIPVKTEVTSYSLLEVNRALDDLRHGRLSGAAVVVV